MPFLKNSRQIFWVSTLVMINVYMFLSFGVGYLSFLQGPESQSVFEVWFVSALIKVALSFLYFKVTKRTFIHFLVATILAVIARLTAELPFLMVVLSFQFFMEFGKGQFNTSEL